MNEEILKDMPEYVKNLPKPVQDLVFEGVWEERTEEIAKKYSLSETQTDTLTNNVLFVLIGLLDPDNFLETTINDLEVSRLLMEQIMEDLEVRVFEYSIKTIQNQEKKTGALEKAEDDDLPELRPEITPMVEPEERVRVRPVPVGFAGATPKPQIPKPELVQRPVSVPRYTAVPMEEEGSNQEPVASSKENVPHQSVSGPQASTSPQPVPEPVKKYAVDPYREPLE